MSRTYCETRLSLSDLPHKLYKCISFNLFLLYLF